MLGAGGEMAELIYRHPWEETPLGQPQGWPAPLRVALGICLNSSFPMAPIPGDRHPDALGRPAREVWPDIWHIIEPQFREVLGTGRGYSTSGQHLPMTRHGRAEESYWDYSFIPIAGEDGRIAGIMNQGHEVTARVFERQRHGLLLGLADRLRALDSEDAIAAAAMNTLGPHLGVALCRNRSRSRQFSGSA
jgi:hypothetical protein